MARVEADVIPLALQLGWVRNTEPSPRLGSPSSYSYSFEQPAEGQRRELTLFFSAGEWPYISIAAILSPGPRGYEGYTVSVNSNMDTELPRQRYLDRLLHGPMDPPPGAIETSVVSGTQCLALLQAFILTGATHRRLEVRKLRPEDET